MASTMKASTGVFVTLLCVVYMNYCDGCKIPSRHWCDNTETASSCGVLDQCRQYEWAESEAKVELGLYYESLCPGCREFFMDQLTGAYSKLKTIMNVNLVPYGNAFMRKSGNLWKFECQHGGEECKGNLIETCAIAKTGDPDKYFPYIACIEASDMFPADAAKECSKKYDVPYDEIMECTKSLEGNRLEHEMGVKTDNLRPEHQYVPWITVNGVHTDKLQNEAQNDLIKLICDTYKGPKKPEACTRHTDQA